MGTNQPPSLTADQERDFRTSRHYYLRVNSQGQNRLTISTFLTGLTFASFAALLASPPVASPTVDLVLFAVSGALMGVATLLFLLAAASTYAALQLLANVSPGVAKAMDDGTPTLVDERHTRRLHDAYETFMGVFA